MADSEILRPEPSGPEHGTTRPTHHETVIVAVQLTAYSDLSSYMRNEPAEACRAW
jgi:hypothetical protein